MACICLLIPLNKFRFYPRYELVLYSISNAFLGTEIDGDAYDKRKMVRCLKWKLQQWWEEEVRSSSVSRRAMGQNQQKLAHISESVLKPNRLPGGSLERTAVHQKPQHPAYTWTVWSVAHNPSKAANRSSLQTTSLCPAPASFIYSRCKFFQNQLHLSSPSSYIEDPASPRTMDVFVFFIYHW